ncbi:putative kynureninase [Aspergillus nomiae NRRL 13137]|uniref:Kynureninase n=1 Tax=Aspergillus nomiae NRRL (strain ATCC 15546 / NRRL 13137 / CBS 260.88 / M93) TaxID=1509407 RepID=A0A0L1J636_ASPN3|nr:putative kynureninase [Aspergillus nomiae NRRL 13137]KNG86873.1 putative kynureninase [Aspergillus nomiae NRRL 13137]
MSSVKSSKPVFPENAGSKEYAASLDAADPLASFREKFIIPSKANVNSKKLAKPGLSSDPCIYFCGNSLGIQPKATAKYLEAQLDTWSSIGVSGHFVELEGSPLKSWQLLSEQAAASMSKIVGAQADEVAAMGTLTANLHLLLASFYKPTPTKHKILLDWKAFPSDHYAIESHLAWHDLDPKQSMVLIGPDEGEYEISTEKILSYIDEHAESAALILLPGIQYYTGQLFDIQKITAYAQSRNLTVGWDLAHAYGNAEPIPGAGGWQLSNPSAIDLASLCASLSVFDETSMAELRKKSVMLTAYLEHLLLKDTTDETRPFRIITPLDPEARGAQLSLLLKPGLLQNVSQKLQEGGIVCDKREPGVVRVAPTPLYNTFTDVWKFVSYFKAALDEPVLKN